jgi:predicted HTH domain antitoxin
MMRATISPSFGDLSAECRVVSDYLAARISLGKAAELLETSRFELQARFERLGLPVRLGPSSVDEARAEAAAARLTLRQHN